MKTTSKRLHRCAYCGRRLKTGRWIYSRHTGARYCWPGNGCNRFVRILGPDEWGFQWHD